MPDSINIFWFELDLRLSDNPGFNAAINSGNVLPIFILDEPSSDKENLYLQLGGASRWWLHHALSALKDSLNGKLSIYQGNAHAILSELCEQYKVNGIYWNRRYEPWRIARDKKIKQDLKLTGSKAHSFNGSLLHEPWTILKGDNTPYKIFTPYHRMACNLDQYEDPLLAPTSSLLTERLRYDQHALSIDDLRLLPSIAWDSQFYTEWQPGEINARKRLDMFFAKNITHYREGRDFPALQAVSRLSPHLHFGEISPKQIIHALRNLPDDDNKEHFQREIRWREFSYYLLFHWPNLPKDNLKTAFDTFTWENNKDWLASWQQGLTGYPLVDAGMRELWQTGFMHNRVRMITASFLIKNLLIDWRLGAAWFWNCLVDADLASNSASWQWVAGCGTDASPYFRIFNPITQGEKFDASGDYTRRYVPELQNLPKKYLFRPWEAPEEILREANVVLGENYPHPLVDIKQSRQKALDAYALTKKPK